MEFSFVVFEINSSFSELSFSTMCSLEVYGLTKLTYDELEEAMFFLI